ncbi:hypothetical protein [Paenibacillus soyae]|uniref:YhfM-like domain-containing protein n=1 Tax=Paenibacillus soyae TaxID=2969249 RepID=A0A9X2MQZ7_9BACL|nr:hypothetical protein [Paenibacillus soyae]MCR2806653.1 hypothetical protein [Paenibacillus soyae]
MVKKIMIYLVLCSFVLLIGCSKEQPEPIAVKKNENPITIKKNENNLNLYLSKPEGQNYTVYKKIEDIDTVKTVMDILLNVQWEKAKVQMSRHPDYKILTVNIDPTISYEQVTYAVWLSPKKDKLEVIIEGQSKFGKVTEEDFKKLLSILEVP